MVHPDWVLRQKTKGTEIRKIGPNYYLYKIRSQWDKDKKRAQKITEKFLGTITEEGLRKPKVERLIEAQKNICVKEFGASQFIKTESNDIIQNLKETFPDIWKEIFTFAVFRFFSNSPLKNVQFHYQTSYLSEIIKSAKVSSRTLSDILQTIGKQRTLIKTFLSEYIIPGESIVVDLTHIFSKSEDIISATLGRNADQDYTPQINLLLLFSLDRMQPMFYRLLPGSIRDVSSLLLSIEESGVKDIIIIGDKGFYSENNTKELDFGHRNYILPLKRNSSLIDYSPIAEAGKKGFEGHFLFEKRVIWYYERKENRYLFSWGDIHGNDNGKLVEFLRPMCDSDWVKTAKIEKIDGDMTINVFTEKQSISLRLNHEKTNVNIKFDDGRTFELNARMENSKLKIYENSKRIVTFLDGKLKVEEEKDCLIRAKDDKDKLNEFYENEKKFGTITIITGTNLSAQEIFELLKSRTEIEVVFDTFKNTLHADRSYMGDDFSLEGWMFVNFIALLLYYKVYALLMSKDLLNNCSPKDVILHLSRVYKVKIGDEWMLSEVPKKSRLLIEKLSIEKTIT
jgi:transposase